MPKETHRIVIDTNLWVSLAMGSRTVGKQLMTIILSEKTQIFSSIQLFEELTDTLQKPRLQPYLTKQRTKDLFDLLEESSTLISVSSNLKLCRDPKDDFLLNLAIDSKANYILTGDKDLLTLEKVGSTQILTISEYLAL